MVLTPTKCLNKEVIQQESRLNVVTWRKIVVILQARNTFYQNVPNFNRDLFVAYRNCGLSYRSIVVDGGRDPVFAEGSEQGIDEFRRVI